MWSTFFVISIAQAIFMLVILLSRKEKKKPALNCLVAILTLILIANIDLYVVSSDIYKYSPHLFGVSMGFMFLFGPLLFFYSKATSNGPFTWKWQHLMHLSPYVLHLLLNIPFYSAPGNIKLHFIDGFVQHGVPLRSLDKVMISLQTVHLSIYLIFTMRSLVPGFEKLKLRINEVLSKRMKWIRALVICFATYWLCVLCLLVYTLKNELLVPQVNYAYTLVTSAILYFIAYRVLLSPEILKPEFSRKSIEAKAWEDDQVTEWIANLESLMQTRKLFRNADLKLESLAGELNIPPHQLSRLLNEKLQKSFADYVNEYRVNDFIDKLGDTNFQHYNVYGLATESGFKSKSTFNSSFKKHTGKTPTEFRKLN